MLVFWRRRVQTDPFTITRFRAIGSALDPVCSDGVSINRDRVGASRDLLPSYARLSYARVLRYLSAVITRFYICTNASRESRQESSSRHSKR